MILLLFGSIGLILMVAIAWFAESDERRDARERAKDPVSWRYLR